jgi:hypothetical protein
MEDEPVSAGKHRSGMRCVVHRTPIWVYPDGHAACARWLQCGSHSDVRLSKTVYERNQKRALAKLLRRRGRRRFDEDRAQAKR